MNRTFSFLRSRLVTAAATCALAAIAAVAYAAPPLYEENFNYNAPSGLVGQGGWATHSGGGTNAQTVNAGNLSYPAYPSSGIGNLLGPIATSGEDTNHGFAGQSSGAVYAAVLINMTSAQAAGDYFFHFFDGAIAGNLFRTRLFAKSSGAGYQLGIQSSSSTASQSYAPAVLTFGTTHLVVIKYQFVAGAANDMMSLYIDPPFTNEGAPQATSTTVSAEVDAANIDGICFRQGSAGNAARPQIDGVRVADNWADALGLHTITATADAGTSISPSGAVLVGDGADQTFTISAADKCHFVSDVLVDGVSQGPISTYTFMAVTTDHTIAVVAGTLGPFTITSSAGPGGSISPGPGMTSVACGGSQTYNLMPNPGYHVSDLVVDGVSQGPISSYTFTDVQANHTISGAFAPDPAVVGAQSTTTVICPTNPCVTLPVTISRGDNTPVLGFTVDIQLSPNLTLCAGKGSITEGTFLSSAGATQFLVVTNGGGSYTVDGAVLGNDCGPTAMSGVLFNVAVTSTDPDGIGSITVTSVQLRDCANQPLAVNPGPPGTVPIDNAAPVVTVTSPNGGESWLIGSMQKISWIATDNVAVANVDIAYSTDGGATYPNVIATGVPNTGTFTWTVPNTPTTTARVRVTAHDTGCSSGSDDSDADFTIRDPIITASAGPGGSISPNGPTSVPYGASQKFTITPDDKCHVIADVLVDGVSVGPVSTYTFNNVTDDHTIAASFTALGPFTITATAGSGGSISPSGAVSVNCGDSQTFSIAANPGNDIADVKVDGVSVGPVTTYTFTDVQANHTIAATFNDVSAPIVTVLSPNGGETLVVGSLAKLAWTATDAKGTVCDVDLFISRDFGATYEKVASGIANTGTYVWTVTAPGTNIDINEVFSALFKVVARDCSGNSGDDVSDNPFSIYDLATETMLSMFQASSVGDGIELRWRLSNDRLFSSFSIERSTSQTGPWTAANLETHREGAVNVAVDRAVSLETPYYYRLIGVTTSGERAVLGQLSGSAHMNITSVGLDKIAPNPSRGLMRVAYALPREANVRLSVVDVSGREVALLATGSYQAGRYQATWSGQTNRGVNAPAGMYFVRLQALGSSVTQRVVRAN